MKKGVKESISIEQEEIPMHPVIPTESASTIQPRAAGVSLENEDQMINCLRNERVMVKFISRAGTITDPRHVCFGRMHENSKKTFTVPMLTSGTYVNVLTNSEKKFLEYILGLEPNALSVYKKENNFWDESTGNSLATVTLNKFDNILDLSVPEDYIRYKILLANKNLIAPSYEEYQDHPKATYLYYITSDSAESKKAIDSVGYKSKAYMELGKMSENIDKMRMVLELITGRSTSSKSKAEFLQVELGKCIDAGAKDFLKMLADPLLDTKVFIKQCNEAGLIAKRGDWYYTMHDNMPLCEQNEDPTLNIAAKYLNAPKHQEVLFSLQAKLKN